MFKKHKCSKCGKGLDSKANFCSNCGLQINSNEDFGMLGKNDLDQEKQESMFGGLMGGGMLNKMINNTMKMLEKEIQKGTSEMPQAPKKNLRLMINGKEIPLNQTQTKEAPKKEIEKIKLPQNNLEKFSELPKKEPETQIRRLSDKIIYEIKLPGVKSIKDISMRYISDSIELKAMSKTNSYSKTISIGAPLVSYNFSKGILVLEFLGN
jgi:HSP20 family molecular chaperone IbpA